MQVATKDTQIQVENPKIELSPAVKELQQKIQDAQTQTISDADLAALYIELGKAYRAQMLFRSAIDTYSIGLTRVPFSKELYRYRGHAYLNLRRYSEGAADFEMALRIDPVYWDALYHLGLCYYLLGDYRRAKAVLARCRAVSADDGSFISATDWYCLCCMRLGEIDEMKEAAAAIHEGMEVGAGVGYYDRCLAYNGTITLEQAISIAESRDDHMYATGAYGLAVYYECVLHQPENAKTLLQNILSKDTTWAGFAEHAAYEDIKRL